MVKILIWRAKNRVNKNNSVRVASLVFKLKCAYKNNVF